MSSHVYTTASFLYSQSCYYQYIYSYGIFLACLPKEWFVLLPFDGSYKCCSFCWSCYIVYHCCPRFDKGVVHIVDVIYNDHHYYLQFAKEVFRVVVVGYNIHHCFSLFGWKIECFALWWVMLLFVFFQRNDSFSVWFLPKERFMLLRFVILSTIISDGC